MTYQIAAITHPGIKEINQDNFFCNGIYKKSLTEQKYETEMKSGKNRNVYAVMDGVGGLHEGETAALTACKVLYETCWIKETDVASALLEADRSIYKTSQKLGHMMGSTCVIVEEKAGFFRTWSVGDSRAYYYSEDKLIQITKDHTEAENARTIQGITGESFEIPDRYEHILTQYLGADKSVYMAEPFVSDWTSIRKGEAILLCSDGLYNFVDIETIKRIINENSSTIEKCEKLIDTALINCGKDNITVVLIEDEH